MDAFTLQNCTLLTVDDADNYFPNGRIVIEEGRITAIGNASTPAKGELVDMGSALVMPGLINTHTHSHSSLFRGQADDLPLMQWLETAMWPMEAHLNAERSHTASLLSCLEYIKSGITTYADQFYFAHQTALAAQKSGLRCFLAPTVFEKPSPETADTLQAAVDFIEKWRGKEEETLVYPCIGPHAPYSVSAGQFRQIVELSEKHDLLIHTHISETQDENEMLQGRAGLTPTAWLESLGVLSRPVLAAHSIHLTPQDIDLYAKHGVRASYNPVSNMKLASGIMPMAAMQKKGIPISIGTDGAQSNNTMDILRDLRTGILLQKLHNQNAAFIRAKQGVRMATIEGARALGMQHEIGSLEVGKRADLIALNPQSVRLVPLHKNSLENLYAAVCYAACGADVQDSMVNGCFVMRGGKVLTLNEAEVLRQGQEASEYLVRHAGLAQ